MSDQIIIIIINYVDYYQVIIVKLDRQSEIKV